MSLHRILMLTHDSVGLSHTWRTHVVASHIASNLSNSSILILSDLSIIGRLKFPQNVDYVHLPGLASEADNQYQPRSLNLELDSLLRIRKKIAQGAAKTFKPNLVIVDRVPGLLTEEVASVLGYIKQKLPNSKIVWGIPDTLGAPEPVVKQWRAKRIHQVLQRFCDEVWVYGRREVFDFVDAYQISPELARKVHFTGYLNAPTFATNRRPRDFGELCNGKPTVMVTAGSGADGFALIDNFLNYLEQQRDAVPFHSLIITGPMMPSHLKHALMARADKLPEVVFHRFSKHFLEYVRHADLIVGTGGYNMFCEILTYRKHALLVPGNRSPFEHLQRVRALAGHSRVPYLEMENLSPEILGNEIVSALARSLKQSSPSRSTEFPLNGLPKIMQRVKALLKTPQLALREKDPLSG